VAGHTVDFRLGTSTHSVLDVLSSSSSMPSGPVLEFFFDPIESVGSGPPMTLATSSVVEEGQDLVTIVIPTRNRAVVLPSAVRSAMTQTYRPIEIVVVDDGSTDETPAVLEELSSEDQRIRAVRQDQRGHGAARNRGMAEAEGEWILFLDDDDILCSRCVERLLRTAISVGTDVVACRAMAFQAPLLPLTEEELLENRGRFRSWPLFGDRLPDTVDIENLALQPLFPPPGLLLKRSSILEAGGFDESLPGAEDYDCWFRVLDVVGPFPMIQDSLAWIRFHPGQTSSALGMMAASTYRVLGRVTSRHPELTKSTRFRLRMGILCQEAAYSALSRKDPHAARRWAAEGIRWTQRNWKLWAYLFFSKFPGFYNLLSRGKLVRSRSIQTHEHEDERDS